MSHYGWEFECEELAGKPTKLQGICHEQWAEQTRTRLLQKDEQSLMFKEETNDIKKQGCVRIIFVNSVILSSEISVMPNSFIGTVLILKKKNI